MREGETWATSIHIYTGQGPTLVISLNLIYYLLELSTTVFTQTKPKKLLLKYIIHYSFVIVIRGMELKFAYKYISRAIYLLLKASRCVFSIKSPLSIMVRLEWESCSRLLEAIIRLSIHLLINSCSFSRPVLPVRAVKVNYICTTLGF